MFIELIQHDSQWFKATGHITVFCVPFMRKQKLRNLTDKLRKISNKIFLKLWLANLKHYFLSGQRYRSFFIN